MKGWHWLAYGITAAVRLWLLMNDNVRDQISSRVEVSTPVTSFMRIKEGAYLWEHGASPYSGDALHQPPLVLFLLYPFAACHQVWRALLFTSIQLLCAYVLKCIAELYLLSDEARPSCSLRGKLDKFQVRDPKTWSVDTSEAGDVASVDSGEKWVPHAVSLIYLAHPYSIMTCVGMSTLVLDHALIALAILASFRGRPLIATLLLAFASHMSLYFVLLVPAVTLILSGSTGATTSGIATTLAMFSGWMCLILALSWLSVGNLDFVACVYGFVVFVPDLVPNVGLFWYFFMEIFDHFKSFFLFIFQYHIAVYPIPLAMRLSHRPTFLAICMLSIIAIFKSYPSVGDSCLCFALGPLFHRELAGVKHMFHLCNVMLFVTVLAPLFWHLWIVSGSGNSNFYYALTVVFAAAQVLLLTESMLSVFRFDRRSRRSAAHSIHRKAAAFVDT